MSRREVSLTPPGTPDLARTSAVTVVDKGWGREVDGVGEVLAYHEPQESGYQRLHVQIPNHDGHPDGDRRHPEQGR